MLPEVKRALVLTALATTLLLAAAQRAHAATVTCLSKPGQRSVCPADTAAGVVLVKPMGEVPCVQGKNWDVGEGTIWVTDGCGAEFAFSPVCSGAGNGIRTRDPRLGRPML